MSMKPGDGCGRPKETRQTSGPGASYLVRVYRHREEPGGFIGVVESVEDGSRRAFANCEELWTILVRAGVKPAKDAPRSKKT